MIELKLREVEDEQLERIIGNAVMRHLGGGSGYYDEDGDWIESGRDRVTTKATEIVERLVTEKAEEYIRTELESRVKAMIDQVFEEGFQRAYSSTMKPRDFVAKVLKEKSWDAPREHKNGGMNFIEFVAWKASKGQIEEEAKRLVEEMRESLSQQIAQNLGDQLAGRMLKGAR